MITGASAGFGSAFAKEAARRKYRLALVARRRDKLEATAEECRAIGEWIGGKLNACNGPVRLLLPERGVSALDVEGGPFWDPAADAALFDALERTIVPTPARQVIRLPVHINDAAFAQAAADAFLEIMP